MPLNIIVKGQPPKWRKNQPTLDRWERSNGDKDLDIAKQYDPLMMSRIIRACRNEVTTKVDQYEDEIPEGATRMQEGFIAPESSRKINWKGSSK